LWFPTKITISLVARQREVEASVDNGLPRRDNLPVPLYGNAKRLVSGAREIGGHCATGAEAGVERAIAGVARQREIDSADSGRSWFHFSVEVMTLSRQMFCFSRVGSTTWRNRAARGYNAG
jgi:hypothetical protein